MCCSFSSYGRSSTLSSVYKAFVRSFVRLFFSFLFLFFGNLFIYYLYFFLKGLFVCLIHSSLLDFPASFLSTTTFSLIPQCYFLHFLSRFSYFHSPFVIRLFVLLPPFLSFFLSFFLFSPSFSPFCIPFLLDRSSFFAHLFHSLFLIILTCSTGSS